MLAAALGLRDGHAATLANLPNANAREQLDARHMNRALWPATWGYFLSQMIGAPLTDDATSWHGRGDISSIRARCRAAAHAARRQTAVRHPARDVARPLEAAEPVDDGRTREVALKEFLLKLRELWRGQLPRCRASAAAANPDSDFADIFSMDGVSSSYAIRHLMGEHTAAVLAFLFPRITRWTAGSPRNKRCWRKQC